MEEVLHSKTEWNKLVKEGKTAVHAFNDANWRIADLSVLVAPDTLNGAKVNHYLTRWMAEIEFHNSLAYLRHLRSTSLAWPIEKRRPDVNSFSTHRSLNAHPDRFKLIRKKMIKAEAQEVMHTIVPKLPSRKPKNRLDAIDGINRVGSAGQFLRSAFRAIERSEMNTREIKNLELKLDVIEDCLDDFRTLLSELRNQTLAA